MLQLVDNDYCESFYGPSYLTHLAENHIPYCESGTGEMECFVTHIHDPICVARGVAFRSKVDDGQKHYGFDCKIRNLTTEIAADVTGKNGKDLEKFENIEDIHEYFYWTGVRMQLDEWDIGSGPTTPSIMHEVGHDGHGNGNCDKKRNDGKITFLVKRELNHNIWHKLMELWQAMVTLDALEMTTWQPSGALSIGSQPFLTPEKRREVQVVWEDEDDGPVDSLWPLVTGSAPVRMKDLNDTCFGTVILPLAGSSSPFWDSHWTDRDCHTKFMLEPFLRRIYRVLGLSPKQRLTESTSVTFVDRRHGTRQIHNLVSHVEHLRKAYPDIQFNVVDFAQLALKEQIELARNTDVLVGVMGAGMTHILFLPDESTVAELMAPGTHYSGFRNLSKQRGLPYFTAHGLTEEDFVAHNANKPTDSKKQEHGKHGKEGNEGNEGKKGKKGKKGKESKEGKGEYNEQPGDLEHADDRLEQEDLAHVKPISQAASPSSSTSTNSMSDGYPSNNAGSNNPSSDQGSSTNQGSTTPPSNSDSAASDANNNIQRSGTKTADTGNTNTNTNVHAKRHWQEDKYLYFTEDMFTALIGAAINAQLNRGTRAGDVVPVA